MDAARLRELVAAAELPSLLAALAHATGDRGLAPASLWLDPARALESDDGWAAEQVAQAQELAVAGLQRLADARNPDGALVPELIDWLTGTDLDADYRTMLAEELAVTGDLRVPEPVVSAAATGDLRWPGRADVDHPVAVIGAGMSGILAAHRLTQAGIDFVVLDKNDDVGGTWLENTYPGCRVDVFNHVYSYSGEQRPDWPEYHSSQPVLLDYFRDCARRWGITDRIRFGTEVESLTWDDAAPPLGRPHRQRRPHHRDHRRRGRVRGRAAQPAADARHFRARQLRRRAVPQLGVAPRHRLERPERRRDRHRGQRAAVHPTPGRRSRARDRVPADPAVADTPPRLPRASGPRFAGAVRAGARLRALVPAAAVLVHP